MPEATGREGERSERRRAKRVSLKVPIECRVGNELVSGLAENISVTGLLVRVHSAHTFPQNTEIVVSFSLPESFGSIHTRARVAHEVPGVFMGVEFLERTSALESQIEKFILFSEVPASTQ